MLRNRKLYISVKIDKIKFNGDVDTVCKSILRIYGFSKRKLVRVIKSKSIDKGIKGKFKHVGSGVESFKGKWK